MKWHPSGGGFADDANVIGDVQRATEGNACVLLKLLGILAYNKQR